MKKVPKKFTISADCYQINETICRLPKFSNQCYFDVQIFTLRNKVV